MTASEPLSLEEEYKMQEEWINDEKSLLFLHGSALAFADVF